MCRFRAHVAAVDGYAVSLIADFAFCQETEPVCEEIRSLLNGIRACGQDRIQFQLVTNRGEQPKPLAKIASGGEISRVMLAIKRVLSAEKKSCVLVFDEIDTGISGRTASKVGQKLKEIAQKTQVICISHLAQVAAWAGSHYAVRKSGSGDRTWVELYALDDQEKTIELARLLSGEEVTPISMENARMLRNSCLGEMESARLR